MIVQYNNFSNESGQETDNNNVVIIITMVMKKEKIGDKNMHNGNN